MAKINSAKMGRPEKPFDVNVFEGLCHLQCTKLEIAGVMNISEDTLERRCKDIYGETYAVVWEQKSASGRLSIRRAQMRLAESGNPTMLIFLGKQYLGQRDAIQIDVNKLDSEIDVELRRLAQLASRGEDTALGASESEAVN